MVQRIGGTRRKTRFKLAKTRRARGKISIRKFFQEFNIGEKVVLKAEPSYQKGMYHPRFHGRCGIIKGQQGRNYSIEIKDGKLKKHLIVHPIHLKKI